MRGYAGITTTYLTGAAVTGAAVLARGRADIPGPAEIVLLGVASHKLARLLAKTR